MSETLESAGAPLKLKENVNNAPRLVVFDVEGVIVPKRHYLLLQVYRRLGIYGVLIIAVVGFLYEVGIISIETALRKAYGLFQGVPAEDFFHVFGEVPLMPGAKEVLQALKNVGHRTALLSSGLPTFLVKDLADRLGADHAFGLDLDVADGLLTGRIGGEAIKPCGKALLLRRLLKEEEVSSAGCAVVVDDRNNLPMFPFCKVRVGYNPDFVTSIKCDFVVKSLPEILPIVGVETATRITSSSNEKIREAIHLSGFLIPVACLYLGIDRFLVSFLLVLLSLFYAASEFARVRGDYVPLFSTVTLKAATGPELLGFAAAPLYLALGIVFSLVVLPAPVCYASVAALTLGDSFASIFGRTMGKHTVFFNRSKTVEGSVFGFLSAFLGASLFISPWKALAGAAVGMLVEAMPSPVNDNLTIPVASGLALLMIP